MSTSAGRVVLTFDVDDKGVVQGLGRELIRALVRHLPDEAERLGVYAR